MRKILYLLLFVYPCILSAQENDTVSIEKFDFDLLGDEHGVIIERTDGWRVVINSLEYREYPPDSSYYCVEKIFYPNGNLKEKGKLIPPGLKIGEWKYYDEQGHLARIVDEDARFGKIKPEDILMFAVKMRFIARSDTYYNVIVKYTNSNRTKVTFREVQAACTLVYNKDDDGVSNLWTLRIFSESRRNTYLIDGDTGEICSYRMDYMDGSGRGATLEGDGDTIFNFPSPNPPERLTRPKKQINRIKERERPRPR